MATYLLDADHLAYLQKRHPRVIAHLGALHSGDRVLTSVVAVAELLRGVWLLPRSRRQRELLDLYGQVIASMDEVLPLDRPVAEKFAQIDAALRRKGRPIPINDIWVAAVSVVKGTVLVSADAHYSFVDHLRLENWAGS